ncbi:MAG: 4-alpha-glucanotransferase [bacterium]
MISIALGKIPRGQEKFCASKANNNSNIKFGRAFTDGEFKQYKEVVYDAFEKLKDEKLGSNNFTAILFDSSCPSDPNKNTGIGTTFSDYSLKFLKFMKDMFAVDTVQVGPQGELSPGITSPYSGSSFSLGKHLIDPFKLTTKEYGEILNKKIVDNIVKENPNKTTNRVPYNYVLKKYDEALNEAYKGFNNLSENHKLKQAFKDFKEKNNSWLEKNSIYQALSRKYGTDFYPNWQGEKAHIDKNLYGDLKGTDAAKQRIAEIKQKHANEIKFNEFCQFIADKQQKESKQNINNIYKTKDELSIDREKNKKMDIAGDFLIGTSPMDEWSNKKAFNPGHFLGAMDNGKNQYWGSPAFKHNEIGTYDNPGESGKFVKDKSDLSHERYDSERLDAAWQWITPWIYKTDEKNRDKPLHEDGNYWHNAGNQLMNIILKSAKNKGVDPNKITLENLGLGLPTQEIRNVLDNLYIDGKKATPLEVMLSRYGDTVSKRPPNRKIFTPNCHDQEPIIEVSRNQDIRNNQANGLAADLKLNPDELRNNEEKFRKAKLAQPFLLENKMLTAYDMFGMGERFNTPGTSSDNNWTLRMPGNYEEFYHRQVANGYGLNLAEALEMALKAKSPGQNNELIQKLDRAANVLKEKNLSIFTRETANNKLGKDKTLFRELNKLS